MWNFSQELHMSEYTWRETGSAQQVPGIVHIIEAKFKKGFVCFP